MKIHPVILAGGCGTRLWPLSRESFPKQFLPLLGKGSGATKDAPCPPQRSPFQETLERCAALGSVEPAIVVTNREHRFLVAGQALEARRALGTLYLEPFGRSTAPALAIVAHEIRRRDPEALLLVLPADHD